MSEFEEVHLPSTSWPHRHWVNNSGSGEKKRIACRPREDSSRDAVFAHG